MNLFLPRYILQFRFASRHSSLFSNNPCTTAIAIHNKTRFSTVSLSLSPKSELLVVVGGGAAGIYGAIRAKTIAPNLNVVVIEKGKPLSKVKISGGGRCNVTNGHCPDNMIMADHYPRGYRELKGSFFNTHGPVDTMSWFCDHGVELKTEDDGRVFPVSNSSASVIDCLMSEVKRIGVVMQTGKVVTTASTAGGKFCLKIEKRTIDYVESVEADYLFIASGSSQQGYTLATQLGHSIIEPVPSLFTFKIDDSKLTELSGGLTPMVPFISRETFFEKATLSVQGEKVSFVKVKAKLELETVRKNIQQLTQVGPMLVTHWGLSGPVILRLSAWGARYLSSSDYKGILYVDFAPDLHIEHMKSVLVQHKNQFAKLKMLNSYPLELGLVKRFWKYLLDREGIDGDLLWASVSNNSIMSIASLLKQCPFKMKGKGVFKDEFVTAGGVPLSEISLKTMESKLQPHLFFAGEVLNIDGVTGGFNFQNAWSGGHIAGTTIGSLATPVKIVV